jgi:hypothetical protein
LGSFRAAKSSRPVTATDDPAVLAARLRADVTERLAPVCADWPTETLEAVVAGIVAVTLKYDVKTSGLQYDCRTVDRLISEMKGLADRAARAREQ